LFETILEFLYLETLCEFLCILYELCLFRGYFFLSF